MNRFETKLAALIQGKTPFQTTARPDGSIRSSYKGFVVGFSKGAGDKTHGAWIHVETKDGVAVRYTVQSWCMGKFGSNVTSVPYEGTPTCKRCAKNAE